MDHDPDSPSPARGAARRLGCATLALILLYLITPRFLQVELRRWFIGPPRYTGTVAAVRHFRRIVVSRPLGPEEGVRPGERLDAQGARRAGERILESVSTDGTETRWPDVASVGNECRLTRFEWVEREISCPDLWEENFVWRLDDTGPAPWKPGKRVVILEMIKGKKIHLEEELQARSSE